MNNKSQPGRRLVGKGEYVQTQSRRAGLRFWAMILYVLAAFFALSAASCVIACLITAFSGSPNAIEDSIYNLLGFGFVGSLAWLLRKWGNANVKRAREIEPGILFTRANTANLPAPDSLVRASSEPVQAQETVLLRAAQNGQGESAEQLLRAAAAETREAE